MIEAVIAIPVFALALAGIGYFHALIAAKQQTAQRARHDAWQTALDGCRTRANAKSGVQVDQGTPPEGAQSIADAANRHASTQADALFPSLDEIPLVGSLISELAPKGVSATIERDVPKPKLFAFDQSIAKSTAFVACNEQHEDPWTATLHVFTSLLRL